MNTAKPTNEGVIGVVTLVIEFGHTYPSKTICIPPSTGKIRMAVSEAL